ncbi:Ekc/Keops Complex Subunit Lage3 [Manis pentadactyla]|nr:Ekc/Keops Complex Subunit Lage3 [Manis pentadactyla]
MWAKGRSFTREPQSLSGRRRGVVVSAVCSEGNDGAAAMQAPDGGMGSAEGQGGAAGGAGGPGGPVGPGSWRDTRADSTAAGVAPQLEGTLIIPEQGGEAEASSGDPERQVLEFQLTSENCDLLIISVASMLSELSIVVEAMQPFVPRFW